MMIGNFFISIYFLKNWLAKFVPYRPAAQTKQNNTLAMIFIKIWNPSMNRTCKRLLFFVITWLLVGLLCITIVIVYAQKLVEFVLAHFWPQQFYTNEILVLIYKKFRKIYIIKNINWFKISLHFTNTDVSAQMQLCVLYCNIVTQYPYTTMVHLQYSPEGRWLQSTAADW